MSLGANYDVGTWGGWVDADPCIIEVSPTKLIEARQELQNKRCLQLLQQMDLVVCASGNGDSMWNITDKGSRVLRHASSMEQCQKVFFN